MTTIIDRRKNPKGKSLENRQRFVKRVKENLKKTVREAIKSRKVADLNQEEKVNIPIKDIKEPVFRHSRIGGNKSWIHPGNKSFQEDDLIEKPQNNSGSRGNVGSPDTAIFDDDFAFTLTREEFLDIFFEDLELPDLVKKDLKELTTWQYHRLGFTNVGSPNNINVERSLKHSLGRRIALKRPKKEDIEKIENRIKEIEAIEKDLMTDDLENELKFLKEELEKANRKMKAVPFIDPIDIRYNLFVPQPKPNTKAVMFCILDVSGSMGEREKDIAKRFFMILHLFLQRRYEHIDLVFIRHHTEAKEVTEEEFFYAKESGGTIVSSALDLTERIIKDRYGQSEWNVYVAQASDGDNYDSDNAKCLEIMSSIITKVQYFCYIDIKSESYMPNMFTSSSNIWSTYKKIEEKFKNFAMKEVRSEKEIFPVFRELFEKK